MKYMTKVFYESDRQEFQEKYSRRISFDSVKHLNLTIKPINQPNEYRLYYVPTNEMINNISEIYRISGELNSTSKKLPPVARKQFVMECLIEELFNTNELEGVKSTRGEIAQSVREVQLNNKDKKRFKSMVKSYVNLTNDNGELPEFSADIRKIYDEITEGEIKENELPDGLLFRKEITHILKRTGTGQVIHRGIIPEDRIISETDKLLNFMNQSKEVPMLIRIAIGHYFFGYIHPFYDGNGRTSRFISSLYLAETLGKTSALSLSRGCNKFRTKYLKAFEDTNKVMNCGELNYFIDTFFSILLETLIEMHMELKEKIYLINEAKHKLVHDQRLNNQNDFDLMFILIQNYYFEQNEGLTVKDLVDAMKISEATVRKIAKKLIDSSLVSQTGLRPAFYRINPTYFEV